MNNAGNGGVGTRESFVCAMHELAGSFREAEQSIHGKKDPGVPGTGRRLGVGGVGNIG